MVDNSSKKCTPGIATRFCFVKQSVLKSWKPNRIAIMYSSAVTLVDCIQSKIFLNIKVYHVWIREGRLLKMPVHKHPWCTYRTFRALLQPPSKPSTLPQKCCFGHGILCCSASGTQATEHCSNIWAQMQPSKLSLELGVPRALMRRLVPSMGLGRLHCSPQLPHSTLRLVGFKTDRLGLRGRQPHERGLRFPHHQTQMKTQDFTCSVVSW